MAFHPGEDKPSVAISACLMGDKVRFDGGHKRSVYVQEQLGSVFDFHSFCPEVAIGLGIPREPIRLVATDKGTRALGTKNQEVDVTDRLAAYANSMLDTIGSMDGYIFMQKSPSCGAFRVKVYNEAGNQIVASEAGIYARIIKEKLPSLPVEEAGRLTDPVLLENFITRVFCHKDWRMNVRKEPSVRHLVEFHSRHKVLLKAHAPGSVAELGRLVAAARPENLAQTLDEYEEAFMIALKHKARRRNHAHALNELARQPLKSMTPRQREEWETLLKQYKDGIVPLVVPLTLLNHYNLGQSGYASRQSYVAPHPSQLGLRNNI